MFTTKLNVHAIPIAKTEGNNPTYLSVLKPLNKKDKEKKLKRKKKCCKDHIKRYCEAEPCCHICDIYYAFSDDSGSSESEGQGRIQFGSDRNTKQVRNSDSFT